MTTQGNPPPVPIDWRNLIQAGRDVLNPQQVGNIPTREHVRRAISDAYYAMFHALAENNAAALIGTPSDAATTAAWSRVCRGLDHALAQRELQRHQQEFSVQAQDFAETFSDMQGFRHLADDDHTASVTAHGAMAYLDRVEAAILDGTQVGASEQGYIAALTVISRASHAGLLLRDFCGIISPLRWECQQAGEGPKTHRNNRLASGTPS